MELSKAVDKTKILFAGALIFSLVISNFVLWSGFSLGFFITVCLAEIGIFLFFPRPESVKTTLFSVILAFCIIALGAAFLLYSDFVLSVISFFVLAALLLIQLLKYSGAVTSDWDSPIFFTEFLLSPIIRPLKFITAIRPAARRFKEAKADADESDIASPGSKTAKKILIGLLATLPVLVVVVGLLSSADQIFGQYTEKFFDLLLDVKISEYLFTLIFGAALFPLLFSFVYSFHVRDRDGKVFSDIITKTSNRQFIDPVIAATSIFCLNIVYALFTWVQFGSLFGAFARLLPADVTFAEYTRQGFFQLCAVALINIVVAITSVVFVSRKGAAGIIVRIMSVLLIAFTYVLLISAGYRMMMYVDVYALSKLRVLVSLFMGLIALLLLYTLIKEFASSFKFFKTAFMTAVLVLIITNYLNTDKLIARYNIDQYLRNPGLAASDSTEEDAGGSYDGEGRNLRSFQFDADYLIYGLSYDAVPALIEFAETHDDVLSENIKASLVSVYTGELKDYRADNWKKYNISKERAKIAIEQMIRSSLQD
ncbi:MAG: DUF4153 domain-containing protein [Saccharofermentanales bacterium]